METDCLRKTAEKELQMNLNQLHYFSKLAEVEHYTKAAEELNISQPSLSHAIRELEKELGYPCEMKAPIGAAISINAGPKVAPVVFRGRPRH